LVLFKGRLAFKQFIRTKRARFGIKLFEFCTHSAILFDFMVYHGKMSNKLLTVPDLNLQISEQILLTLIKPYLNRGHRLFTITTRLLLCKLAQYLLDKRTKLVGTVRSWFSATNSCP